VDPAGCTLVVAVLNPGADVAALQRRLRDAGWGVVINALELSIALGPGAGLSSYWMAHPRVHDPYASQIAATEALFGDEASRDLYRRQWHMRRTGDFSRLPPPLVDQQYLPLDLPPHGLQVRLIDCGAYVGDTIDDLVGKGLDLTEIVAFEPDPVNFARLSDRVARHVDRGLRATLFPCGLGDGVEMKRFAAGGGASSTLDPAGDHPVLCVAIDTVLPDYRATFVKMDIEGAEAGALRGAARLIASHKPRLAVSVYHRPEDLWQLPALVHSIRPDYRLYLRCHAYSGFETVLYAV
jgi:FkbM family methyltransferase